MNEINTQIISFIVDEIKHDDEDLLVDDNTELLISGILDSLGVMQLVTFISNAFSYAVPPGDITIEHFGSVNTLSAYIQSNLPS
jgi:acyl carrier protein